MVNPGYPCSTILKPKSIITRLRIVRFQWFLDQNDRNFMGILFQTSKGQNSFIFDECWRFLWFFDIKIWPFFSKVKNPKNFPRPNSVSPHPGGGGIIWYHMVPYGTIWYLMVPYVFPFFIFPNFSIFKFSIFPNFPKLLIFNFPFFMFFSFSIFWMFFVIINTTGRWY